MLQYGFEECEAFLEGAHEMDEHFRTAPFERNIPVMMGLMSLWNSTFLGYSSRAILPYCQALSKLAPHIQQVSMESNGKGVDIRGKALPFKAGEVDFGEPGTLIPAQIAVLSVHERRHYHVGMHSVISLKSMYCLGRPENMLACCKNECFFCIKVCDRYLI